MPLLEEAGDGDAYLPWIGPGGSAGIRRDEGVEAACGSQESNACNERKEQVAGVLHWTKVSKVTETPGKSNTA